jgi:hypothetical protein
LQGWNLDDEAAAFDASPLENSTSVVAFLTDVAGTVELPVEDYPCVVATDGSSVDDAQAVQIPVSITGRIESPGDVDGFSFRASAGQKIRIRAESDVLGFLLDPALRLIDGAGNVVAEIDDAKNERDAALDFAVKEDGDYRVTVRDVFGHGGLRYVYRLIIEEVRPDFTLAVDANAFALSPGKPLEIPVTVSRSDGFEAPIDVTAEGLPDGVSCQAAQHVQTKDAKNTVTISLSASGDAVSGAFRIVGRTEKLPPRVAHFKIAESTVLKPDLWLTVLPGEAPTDE